MAAYDHLFNFRIDPPDTAHSPVDAVVPVLALTLSDRLSGPDGKTIISPACMTEREIDEQRDSIIGAARAVAIASKKALRRAIDELQRM